MHITTGGLILRVVNYKESDQILTVLTQELGKITLSARGCRKAGSKLAAGVQLLCWSELVIYDRGGHWYVKEAMAQRQFHGVRSDIERLSLACYFAELCAQMAVEGEPASEVLSLTLNSLHVLDKLQEKPLPLVKAVFELQMMQLSGYEPTVDGCVVCGREPEGTPQIHLREGGLHCAACREQVGEGISMPLNAGALAAVRHILWSEPKRAFSFTVDELSLEGLGAFTEAYLLTQLERGFHTLDYYKSLDLEEIR